MADDLDLSDQNNGATDRPTRGPANNEFPTEGEEK
jgi:hypothetical protein